MSSDILEKFNELSAILKQTQHLWKPVAFHEVSIAWSNSLPELAKRLLSFDVDQIERLHFDPQPLIDSLQAYIPELTRLHLLSQLPDTISDALTVVDPRFHAGIPGKKWAQVRAFCAGVGVTASPVLDYCAGKAHLGFYIEQSLNVPVVSLEWQADLVAHANERAGRENRRLNAQQVDVMSEACEQYFEGQPHVVALHACGGLHERLLSLCISQEAPKIHLAPCCYHKRSEEHYLPYSKKGQENDLLLNKSDLHTAVMETVTASASQVSQRKTLQTMRLGFDLIQRDVLLHDTFLPLPSMPLSWSRMNFEAFCRHWAKAKNIPLPVAIDWSDYWHRAQQRFHKVSALDLVRALFRRPLEVWLNMDKALWLEEHGYEVSLSTFCARNVSPRNILLQATRQCQDMHPIVN